MRLRPVDPDGRAAPPGDGALVDLPADLRQLAEIRQQVRTWLQPLALDDGEGADIVQAVNEATTNVIDYAYEPGEPGSVKLTLWSEPGALYVEVIDPRKLAPS
jgi:serine/threonine-protein kinase RsbW